SVYYSFFQTLDCAADFVSAEVTLPPNVTPVSTATPICRRWGGTSPNFIYDPRAGNACPAAVSFNASTRKFGIYPKAGSPVPDFPLPSGRWFIGQRTPQENVLFHSLEFLVPVRATATMTNQPIGLLVCSVGTSCATGGVNLTVGAAPVAADPPRITFAGQAQTTAVGVRVPFAVNSPDSNPEFGITTDISTSPTFSGGRPCGLTGPEVFPTDTTQAYAGDFDNVEITYGDLDTVSASPCALAPSTTYNLKACTVYFTGPTTYTEQHCQTTSFTTGAVATRFTPPLQNATDLAANTNIVTRAHQVVGGHPAGNASIRYRLKGSAGTYTTGPNQNYTASFGDTSAVDRTVSGLTPWRTYELVSCYQAPATTGAVSCGAPLEVATGFATAPSDATGLGATTATLNGQASAPSPAGTMRFLLGTTDPGAGDVRTLLTERASTAMAARAAAGLPVTGAVTGLAPSTTYYWVACFDNPAGAGIEDCSPARSFTTAASPPPPPPPASGGGDPPAQPGGAGNPAPPAGSPGTPQGDPGGAGAPIGTTADSTKPAVTFKIAGKLKRGKRVTLTVKPSDPSGIRSVLIKVGNGKPQAKRKLTITLPRKKGTVRVVITVTDGAGNVTTLTESLKVR
ncbi:MAG: hypothetical protein QOJ12_105, partial [Thermoleophilales bacterium]|nr:hypothetical protein [Thermoleophilales bacterium]